MILNRYAMILAGLASASLALAAPAESPAGRARDLGVPFDGTPGLNNAITDVAGVEVGFKTLNSGEGALVRGKGPVRTGVTAIFPRSRSDTRAVFAGFFAGPTPRGVIRSAQALRRTARRPIGLRIFRSAVSRH